MSSLPLPLAGFLLAFLVRLASIHQRDVWLDEAFTQHALSLDWGSLIADRIAAGHSPLYSLLLKTLGFDPSQIIPLRMLSAVFDSAACAVFGAAVQRHWGWRAALFGMILYATSPVLIGWAQNARPYPLMLLFLAIGTYGATGLLSRSRSRFDAPLMALGLSGASLTLTAGAIAAILVGLSAFGARLTRDARVAWAKTCILPIVAVGLMAVVVSGPAVRTLGPTYWTERVAPLGVDAFKALVRGLTIGDRMARGEDDAVLWIIPWQVVIPFIILPVALAVWNALRTRRAELWPLVMLTLTYPLVLLVISLTTSLLIPRYFLPAAGATMMLVGIGLATLSRHPLGRSLAGVVVVVFAALALNWTLTRGLRTDRNAFRIADIILAHQVPGTTVFFVVTDGIGMDSWTELLRRDLGPGPNLRFSADTTEGIAKHVADSPSFVIMAESTWRPVTSVLPVPTCLWQIGPNILAYWGTGHPDCPAPGISE